MDTSNLTFRNSERNLITVNYCSLSNIFSAEYASTGHIKDKSMMFNDLSMAPPLPPLAAPDDQLLELASPLFRKRDRDK